jgi:glutamate formiminotransferase
MMSETSIVECVPNFSEGVDRGKVEAIVRAMRVEGVHLLDWSMDGDHNRSVVTIAGTPEAVVEAAVRGAGKAAELIDLTQQKDWRGGRGAVCSRDGGFVGAVRDAGAAGRDGDVAKVWGSGVLL